LHRHRVRPCGGPALCSLGQPFLKPFIEQFIEQFVEQLVQQRPKQFLEPLGASFVFHA